MVLTYKYFIYNSLNELHKSKCSLVHKFLFILFVYTTVILNCVLSIVALFTINIY